MQSLETYITEIIETKGWLQFHDIHINEVIEISDKSQLVTIGLELLEKSKLLLEDGYDVLLAVELDALDDQVMNLSDLKNIKSMHCFINFSVPSLYVYERGYHAIEKSIELSRRVKLTNDSKYKMYQRIDDETLIYFTIK